MLSWPEMYRHASKHASFSRTFMSLRSMAAMLNSCSPAGPAPAPATAAEGAVGTPSPASPCLSLAPDAAGGAPPFPSFLRREDETTQEETQGGKRLLCTYVDTPWYGFDALPPIAPGLCLLVAPCTTFRQRIASWPPWQFLLSGRYRMLRGNFVGNTCSFRLLVSNPTNPWARQTGRQTLRGTSLDSTAR